MRASVSSCLRGGRSIPDQASQAAGFAARLYFLWHGARYPRYNSRAEDLPGSAEKGHAALRIEPLDQYAQRQKKLEQIQALGHEPYPHKFDWSSTPAEVQGRYGQSSAAELEAERVPVRVAGRILTLRLHGKAGFAHLQGEGQRLQIYVKLDVVGERGFQLFQLLDLGDVVGVVDRPLAGDKDVDRDEAPGRGLACTQCMKVHTFFAILCHDDPDLFLVTFR